MQQKHIRLENGKKRSAEKREILLRRADYFQIAGLLPLPHSYSTVFSASTISIFLSLKYIIQFTSRANRMVSAQE